jgi:CHAD domain-containing protein
MRDLPTDLLDRPAADAAGQVALRYLDDAVAAAARLSDRTDAEALHDFRVALRRLRVTVRAYPGLRDGVPKKYRRRLRKLARATNGARDVETQIVWFRKRAAQFTPAQRRALSAVRARLRARRRRAQAQVHLKLQQRFIKLERKVRRELTGLRSAPGAHEPSFRAIAAAALARHALDLGTRLADTTATSPADLHATRIAAKRLRYLLEPVEDRVPQGKTLIARLKQLQDVFGGLTDAHELEGELRRFAKTDQSVGIDAAAQLLETEVQELLKAVREEWPAAAAEFETTIAAVARHLRTPAGPARRQSPARRRSRLPA